jgi:hypothetical protein
MQQDQKQSWIHLQNKTVEPVSTQSVNNSSFYNGGDTSVLVNYPSTDKSRFFASGRLPMLTANVTIDGNKQQINI